MKDYYLFTTARGNRYCYSVVQGAPMLCHPLLYQMITIHRRGESVAHWCEGLQEDPPASGNGHTWEPREIGYYYRKFQLLEKAGWFSEHDRDAAVRTRLTPEDVELALRTTGVVDFEMTEACNLRCEYCCYGDHYLANATREGRHLDPQLATRVLRHLFSMWNEPNRQGPERITIGFYGGEPLLRFHVVEQIVHTALALNDGHRPLRFTMTTNGLLLGRYADFLAEHDVDLLVSLDGDAVGHSYRVFGDGAQSHSQVLDNIALVQNRHPAYFDRQVGFISVFNNRSSVERLYDFFSTRFGKTPMVVPLSLVGAAPPRRAQLADIGGDMLASLERSERRSEIEQAMFTRLPPASHIALFLKRTAPFHFRDFQEAVHGKMTGGWLPTGTCIPFAKRLFVTADGIALPCERIGRTILLGRAGPRGLELDYECISREYNARYDRVTRLCSRCHHRNTCIVCMLQLDLDRPDVECTGFASDEGFADYLADVFGYLEEHHWVLARSLSETKTG